MKENLDILHKTRELAKLFGVSPSRSKWQNFLIDESVYDDMVVCAKIPVGATVLEAGPGFGFLTAKLAEAAGKVIAVEMDDRLAGYLETALAAAEGANILLLHQDVMSLGDGFLSSLGKYQVVSNLPYQISSIFLRKFISCQFPPTSLTLMLQKEVAERIVSKAPDMNLLAFSVQYYAEAKIERYVTADSFWPAPEIQSAIIRIELRPGRYLSADDEKKLFRLLKFAFSAKRKMLKNNLSSALRMEASVVEDMLSRHGHGSKIRAENLDVKDWLELFADFKPFML